MALERQPCLTWRTQKTDFISAALCSLALVCLWSTKFLASPVWPCIDPSQSGGSAVWYHWRSELGTATCLGYRKLCFRSAHACGVSAARRPCKAPRCTDWGVSSTSGSWVHRPRSWKVFFSLRMQERSGQDRSSWGSRKSERGQRWDFSVLLSGNA